MPINILYSEPLAQRIEMLVRNKHMTYLDAVLHICAERNLEPEIIAPLLGDKIKSELAEEAKRLHFMKVSNELPF